MEENEENTKSTEQFGILVIEEKSDLRTFYMGALTKSGNYDVKNAATPTQAFEILEDESADINIIIFNWEMTEMPGFVFCQKIKADQRFSHIELIVSSDYLNDDDSFLLTELDIHYKMPKTLANIGEFVSRIDEARENYNQVQHVVKKLKNLQHLIDNAQNEQCEELFKIPEIKNEINTNPRFIHLGGEMLILKRKYEESVTFLKKFLTKNNSHNANENLKSLSTLGKALCFSGKFDDALLIFERLELKSPKNLSHKVMVGDALLGLDDLMGAEKKYNEVLNIDAKHKEALVGMAKTKAADGKFDESKSFFEKIEGSFESRSLASFFNNRGVAFVRRGNIEGAILFYENALQFLDKFKGHVYFNLGMAYYRSGNIASAISSFQAALNSKDASLLLEKTILKDLQNKGVEAFVAEFNSRAGVK